ncbi:MAG TPA: endonuclease domain-containing protein [Xanthobacteraceae bacterium]|jgi:very-short-patch-repair endonuclease|nr:endonuclease domain-containing protein [Xanthobacteraceae bacterium]
MVLWLALRDRRLGGFKFTRQISVGPYIADFVCRERKLIIEVDGGQHADSLSDRYRDEYIKRLGYRILRFWNSDVLTNKDGVLAVIKGELIASGT